MICQRCMRSLSFVLAGLSLSWAALAQTPQPARASQPASRAGVILIKLPKPAAGVTLSPATGDLAVTGVDGSLAVYRQFAVKGLTAPDAAVPDIANAGTDIQHLVIHRQGFFAVPAGDEPVLRLYPDDKILPAQAVRLQLGRARQLLVPASGGASICYFPDSPDAARLGRINLATLKEETPIALTDNVGEGAISADGSTFFARRLSSMPSGLYVWRLPPSSPDAQLLIAAGVLSAHVDVARYFPDPLGQYVACGTDLFTSDFRSRTAQLPGIVQAILPERSLILALSQDQLLAISYNMLRTLASVPLGLFPPPPPPEPGAPPKYAGPGPGQIDFPRVLLDAKNAAVLVCTPDNIAVVPLALLKPPPEPPMLVKLEGPVALTCDVPAKIKLTPVAPIDITLEEAPPGMQLDGNVLSWTPPASSVGEVTVALRLRSSGAERRQTFTLPVRRRFVDLGFRAEDIRLASDGKAAVAFRTSREPAGGIGAPGAQTPYGRVALLDVASASVRADRALPLAVNASAVAFDAHHVYLPLMDADAIVMLSLTDLSEVRRLFTPGRVSKLLAVGDTLFAVCGNRNSNEKHLAFSLPDVSPLPLPAIPQVYANPSSNLGERAGVPIPVRIGGGWLYRGVLFDDSLTTARLLNEPIGLPRIPLPPVQGYPTDETRPPAAMWGSILNATQVQRTSGQIVGEIRSQAVAQQTRMTGTILPQAPAVAALGVSVMPAAAGDSRSSAPGSQHVRAVRAELTIFDLRTAAPSQYLLLQNESEYNQFQSPEQRPAKVLCNGGIVAALSDDRVFFLPAAEIDSAKLPVPLHFDLSQDKLEMDANTKTTIRFVARGGEVPLRYSIAHDPRGVSVDTESGAVTFDPAVILPLAAAQVGRSFEQNGPRAAGGSVAISSARRQRDELAPWFRRLTRHNPLGIPIAVPLVLEAHDRNQQSAVQSVFVLLDVPVDQAMTAAKLPGVAPLPPMPDEPTGITAPSPAGATTTPSDSTDLSALRQCVRELEEQNRQLRSRSEHP